MLCLPSWKYDVTVTPEIWLHQSVHVGDYLKNNPAKFHPDLIWNDGALGFLVPRTRKRVTAARTTIWNQFVIHKLKVVLVVLAPAVVAAVMCNLLCQAEKTSTQIRSLIWFDIICLSCLRLIITRWNTSLHIYTGFSRHSYAEFYQLRITRETRVIPRKRGVWSTPKL